VVQLARFERRAARAALSASERETLAIARAVARQGGSIDLHLLAAHMKQRLSVVHRRRTVLAARGLWPWTTDKWRVGRPPSVVRHPAGSTRASTLPLTTDH
jgi:hypothetical protein